MQQEDRRSAWHQSTVSWGQLIVAGITLIVSVLGAVFIDRNTIEKRVTVIEKDQAYIEERVKVQGAEMTATRAEIIARLVDLQKQMNEVIIGLARHEAAAARVLGEAQKK